MKKVLLFILLCNIFTVFSQKPVIQMGTHTPPDEAKKRRNTNSYLMGGSESEILVSDRAKGGSVITSYNSATLKKTGTFKLDYPEIGKKDADWVRRLFHGDKITSVYGYYNKKEDENKIYGKITDRKNKTIKKETVLMTSSAKKRKNIGQLVTKYSNDNSKLLIFREPAGKKYENEKMEMVLFDEDLNKIFEKELSFPYKNRAISVQEIIVTNDGRVSIVAFWEATKDEIKDNPDLKGQFTFKIFGITEDNEELDEIEIKEKGYALSTCEAFINDDSANTVLLTGFYRDVKADRKKRRNGGVNGIYYFKLNTNTWEIDLMKFNVIDEKTMTKLFLGNNTSERAKKKAKKAAEKGYGFGSLKLKNIFFNTDGSIKIISQVEYVVTVCTTDSKGNRTCTDYYHNEQILEFNLDSDGDLVGSFVIPKSQVLANFYAFNGHIALKGGDKTFYIYNDADKNHNPKKVAKRGNNNFYYTFTGSKKSRLCYVTVDAKGKLSKSALAESWKKNILIYPYETVRLNAETVITWGRMRKSKELVLMKFSMKDGKKSKG